MKRSVDMSWGRLLYAPFFAHGAELATALLEEGEGRRDIAFHVLEPHVVLAESPQQLFLDPSHTYRRDIDDTLDLEPQCHGFQVRPLEKHEDVVGMNCVLSKRGMVEIDVDQVWASLDNRAVTHFVAVDDAGQVIGTVSAVDHHLAFGDRAKGVSLWCLAVDPDAAHLGVGKELTKAVLTHAVERGAPHLDLSVMHDNEQAIALYVSLGFERLQSFTIKRKNPINEPLFVPADATPALNPYAEIIVREAARRGIQVEVEDTEGAFFRLSHGGRTVDCRESLTSLTDAVAMSRCADKRITHRLVGRLGYPVPRQVEGDEIGPALELLRDCGSVVVKPACGEQGRGVSVGVDTEEALREAMRTASASDVPLVQEIVGGEDLRLVVIDYQVVAAAVRRPASVVGVGDLTVRKLIEKQSRRRKAATGGESTIPLDGQTEDAVRAAGYGLDDVLPAGTEIAVRRTANVHSGGTIVDVTEELHPKLRAAAERIAVELNVPVVGLDFMVPSPDAPRFVFIEANERVGLANHEPQPTAERFLDFLFPMTATRD